MEIPFVDLKAQYLSLKGEIQKAINDVIEDSAFVMGKYVTKFEEEFAKFCNVKYAVGVSSGTDALILALKACGIGQDDEVITVPNTFIATTEAITMSGAKVRFVDINPDTYNIDVTKVEEAITGATRAIIPVHLYGQPADIEPILEIAKRHDLKVIEDAAQAHGAEYKGQKVGTFGDVACFSFYPSKNLGAYGDAGIIVTNNEAIAQRTAMLRDHGTTTSKYESHIEGLNCRLDGIQAAILSVKLRCLAQWNEARRNAASLYDKLLENIDGIVTPEVMDGVKHVYHLYVIRLKNRGVVQQRLREHGINTGIHYPIPLHLQPAYRYLNLARGSYPVAERVTAEILSLPMFPELSEEQIFYIVSKLKSAISE